MLPIIHSSYTLSLPRSYSLFTHPLPFGYPAFALRLLTIYSLFTRYSLFVYSPFTHCRPPLFPLALRLTSPVSFSYVLLTRYIEHIVDSHRGHSTANTNKHTCHCDTGTGQTNIKTRAQTMYKNHINEEKTEYRKY